MTQLSWIRAIFSDRKLTKSSKYRIMTEFIPPQPDTILKNRYQIREQEQIDGYNSRKFLAWDLHTQNLVMIRILILDRDFELKDLDVFRREALALLNLSHPGIPQYLDYFDLEEPNRGFAIVQTYINAPSLGTIVEEGRKFTELETIELANRLLSVLTYFHEQDPPIVHRNINPDTILIANLTDLSIGYIYLVNFNLPETLISISGCSILANYYKPSHIGANRSADLYSLGMTLIYAITAVDPMSLIINKEGFIDLDVYNLSNSFSG
jgi:serine/threonine protein kinase